MASQAKPFTDADQAARGEWPHRAAPQHGAWEPRLPASWLWAVLKSRALWLALLAALLLHSAVLLGGAWWQLPWRLPSKQRPSIMVQLLRPPSLAAAAPAPENAAPALPSAALPQPAAPAPLDAPAQKQQNQPPPPAVQPAPAATTLQAPPTAAAEKSELSLMQDMQAPDSVELHYQLVGANGEKTSDSASLRWLRQEDAHYQLSWQQTVGGKGSQMQSVGVLGADGLQPLRYSEAGSDKSEVATHFVADKQQIVFSNNSPSAVLPAGGQDRVSALMQLGGILAAQYEAQALSEVIDMPVAGSSHMRVWRWRVLGLQAALPAVRLAMGEEAATQWLAVRHDPSADGGPPWEPTITVWYDSNGFLPVRIESRSPNGQVLDAQWRSSQDIPSLLTP